MSSVHNRGRILRWQGEGPLPTIPYVNFASEMLKCFEDYEDKVALVDASSGKSYTYRQLQTKISQMKKSLVSAGVNQGDAVLMVCRNHIDTPAALLTILHIGAICVPVGTDLTIGELTHIVGVSKARWAVVTEGSVTKVTEAFSSYDSSSSSATLDSGSCIG
ncbi:hypothetical protein SK128_014656 [Halocaridina rubra]|uniref:AMP-dependent synthetase/ligase domain-containing protein n=1 Tax=Halocaridina rubra TaxID=373956 RepID=A0AAN8WNZ5_HALRR